MNVASAEDDELAVGMEPAGYLTSSVGSYECSAALVVAPGARRIVNATSWLFGRLPLVFFPSCRRR
jgi:hypothetical protein